MITRRLRAGLIAGVAALSIAAVSVPAHAQWIVFDPTNYAQNVLTAARELQQVNNEIQSLENQATMLINQARNLASLPYSSLAQLQQQITQTQQLLAQAQRIAYSVSTIDQAFTQTYPQAYSGSTSSQQLLADAQTRWQNALAGFQDTMRVQAGVVTNLDTTRTQINALVSSSQSATGALQAAQSGNQLVALQTTQLADLTALMASIARAQSLDGGAHARGPGAGPAANHQLPQLRGRLSGRLRADVPLMRGRLLNLPAIGRAAGFALVAAAIVAAARASRARRRRARPRRRRTSASADPLSNEVRGVRRWPR